MIKVVGSPENPMLFREVSLYDFKISVWCVMSATRIIGPSFFFENRNSRRYGTHIMTQFFEYLLFLATKCNNS